MGWLGRLRSGHQPQLAEERLGSGVLGKFQEWVRDRKIQYGIKRRIIAHNTSQSIITVRSCVIDRPGSTVSQGLACEVGRCTNLSGILCFIRSIMITLLDEVEL